MALSNAEIDAMKKAKKIFDPNQRKMTIYVLKW
jgi:hypothetical protein